MGSSKNPGPIKSIGCYDPSSYYGVSPSNCCQYQSVRSTGITDFSQEETELALDISQFALDVVGVFEPTPFADGTNALISVGRGDWLGAGISLLGIIPYLGDAAKVGKFPKYLKTFERAIELARNNANFSGYLRPALEKISSLFDRFPIDKLPDGVAGPLRSIQSKINSFLGRSAPRVIDPFDDLVAELLIGQKGSLKNVGKLPLENVKFVARFLSDLGVPKNKMHEVLSGIDLSKPITTKKFEAGDIITQYTPGGAGDWFVKGQGGVSHRNLGLAEGTRTHKTFKVKKQIETLQSSAAPKNDTWTWGRTRDVMSPVGGADKMKAAELVSGGGEQFYFPNASQVLELVK